jgi:hypothetical protein
LAKIRNSKSPATVRVKDGTGRRETRLLLRYKVLERDPAFVS